jgi:signal transduction histidine kinase
VKRLTDKALLLGLIVSFQFWYTVDETFVLTLLAAAFISVLGSYREDGAYAGSAGALLGILGIVAPVFFVFLPLAIYDERKLPHRFWILLGGTGLMFGFTSADVRQFFYTFLLCLASCLMEWRTTESMNARRRLYVLEDDKKERELYLERKNRELLEVQDYEVRLATLSERNRIAREIHDNVGHLLTRSILQISALEVVHRQEETLTKELGTVKETLTDAMDNVRSSVHDLHEEAVDLPIQLKGLIREFSFCPVELTCDLEGDLPRDLKYSLLAIVKEGLSNIARHSDATQAWISLVEHPALYQLSIRDNGRSSKKGEGRPPKVADGWERVSVEEGMGLMNIRERVEGFRGIFRVKKDQGFQIFISIPKEKKE